MAAIIKHENNAMADATNPESTVDNFDRLSQFLLQQGLLPNAAEVHGMLCGMLAGGANPSSEHWLALLSDLLHEGQTFPVPVRNKLNQLAQSIDASLRDPDMNFQLMLPEDQQPIEERLQAMIGWVQSFLVGFGVNQSNLAGFSADVREAIDDMVELAKLDFSVEDDDDADRAYFEIIEYIRVSVIMCFCEVGEQVSIDCKTEKTLH
jgi:yecA family protein